MISIQKYPEVNLIVATTESGLIGNKDGLPWKSSLDMTECFQKHTMGWPVIFGRGTAEGMGNKFPLQNRPCAVISEKSWSPFSVEENDVLVFSRPERACEFFSNFDKIFIAGGARLYKYALFNLKPMVSNIIKTVFPDECIVDPKRFGDDTVPVMGDKYLDKETMERMKEPGFSLVESKQYEYWAARNTYYCFQKDEAVPIKTNDTLFPWVRFEIWKRQKGK